MPDCCFIDGIRIDHTESEVDAIFQFLVEKDIRGIVELGMHEGGLAYCITKEMPRINYCGVTNNLLSITAGIKIRSEHSKFITILEGDALSADIITKVGTWVAERWTILFYCDGINKVQQITLYRNLVRFGDYLGAHDYWNKSRVLPELPLYSHPEIDDTSLKFLRQQFQPTRFEPLIKTRIAILQRRTK